MFSTTCNERARTPFIHSKRLGPTQAGDCRRVSPRKTNKSLHYKRILRLGRGVQTHWPRYFNGLRRRAASLAEGRVNHLWNLLTRSRGRESQTNKRNDLVTCQRSTHSENTSQGSSKPRSRVAAPPCGRMSG